MSEFSSLSVSAFVAVLNEITKTIAKDVFKKDINKYIPLFSIGYGIILGLLGYFFYTESFGDDLVKAIFIGIASGAAATGYHQIGKQLMKKPLLDEIDPDSLETTEEETDETDKDQINIDIP
jgi:RsiW-degrading membrane proteinase PrsW (M82 family)